MATTAPDKQREQEETRSSGSPTSDGERAIRAQGGRRLAPLTVLVAVGLVVVAALAVWAIFVRSDDNPTRGALANQRAPIAGEASGLPDPAAGINEPMLVVEGFVESLTRGDTRSALAAFAPDATLISPGCQPTCFGIAAITPVLEQTVTNDGQLTLTEPRVEGDTLTAHFTLASQEFPAGVERVTGSTSAVVRDQRIVNLSMYWDPTDPQTASVLNTQKQAAATLFGQP